MRSRIPACAVLLALTVVTACGDKVTRLTQALSSGNDKECESAAKELGAIGAGAASAAPAMFEVVVKQRRSSRPGSPMCWMTVVNEFPKLGPAATSLLITALGDQRAEDAEYVLGAMGAAALPALSKALADPKTVDRAVAAIGLLGRAGTPALADLREAYKKRRITERRFVAAISWFRSEQAVPDFAAALRSEDIEVRWMAARALGDFVAKSPEAVRALSFALQDESPEIRNHTLDALSRAGPAASAALPSVRQAADRRLVSPSLAKVAIARMQPR
jgi:hypothetical protein